MISIGNKKHEPEFRKYLDEHPMPWSQVLLSDQDDENIMRTMERYLVREFRHTYLIGTDGRVIQRFGLRGEDIDRFVECELMPKE